MATSASVKDYSTEGMEEGLTCYICYDLLREPKDLVCPHVFWLLRLQEWVEKKPIIEYPECRYITIVPRGLGNLKTNLHLKTMVENYVKGVERKKGVPMYPNHEGERQHFWCITCGITVCHNCLVLDHPRPQHFIGDLKVITVTKTQDTKMKRKVNQVEEEIKKKKQKEELSGSETKLQGAKDKNKSNIKKRMQQSCSELQAQGHRVMESVENNYQQNLTTISEREQQIPDTINSLQNIETAVHQQHTSFMDQINRLCAQAKIYHSTVTLMNIDAVRVNPVPSMNMDTFQVSSVPSMNVNSVQHNPVPSMNMGSVQVNSVPLMNMGSVQVNPVPSMNVNSVQVNPVPSMNMDSVQVNPVPSMNINTVQDNPVPSRNMNSVHVNPMPSMNMDSVQVSPVTPMNKGSVQHTPVPSMNMGSVQVNPVPSMNMDSVQVNTVPSMNMDSVQDNPVPSRNMNSVHVNPVPSMNMDFVQVSPVTPMNMGAVQVNPVLSRNMDSVQVNPVPSMKKGFVQVNPVPSTNMNSVQLKPVPSMNMNSVQVNLGSSFQNTAQFDHSGAFRLNSRFQASACENGVPSMNTGSVRVVPGSTLHNTSQAGHANACRLPPRFQASTCQNRVPSMNMGSVGVIPGSRLQNTFQVGRAGAVRLLPSVQTSTCQSEMPSLDMGSVRGHPGSSLQNTAQVGHAGAFRLLPQVQTSSCQSEVPSMNMGSVQVNPGSSLQNTSQFVQVGANIKNKDRLKLISECGIFQQAMDVAVTRTGLLAVVDYLGRDASIYRKDNANFKRQYNLNVTGPLAVAATSEGKFFVSDNGLVKVFSPNGRYESTWPGSVHAGRITTTPDDLIVIGNIIGAISVHQSNGELIRTHKVDCRYFGDIASNGKQIAFTTGYTGKVCVIDFVTGHTLWTVDMVMPRGICYEQRGFLLVAGGSKKSGESVIYRYHWRNGRLISCLASGLYVPCSMTVTHDNKLVVADAKTVKVYKAKIK